MALIIDVETTGLPLCGMLPFGENPPYEELDKYNNARIVQISMMICNEQLEYIEMFDFIIKNDEYNIENSNIHGITNEISQEKGYIFTEVIPILLNNLKKVSCIVAHNANFDISIIKSELHRLSMNEAIDEINTKHIVCTMKLTKSIVKAKNKNNRIKNPKLGELYKFVFDEVIENAHNSNYDVINLHKSIKQLYDTNDIFKDNYNKCILTIQIQRDYASDLSLSFNINSLKLNELKKLCKEMGIKKYSKMNKNELIKILKISI